MPTGSDYGVIPYEVDEITAFLETWLAENFSHDEIISALTTYLDENLSGIIEDIIYGPAIFNLSAVEVDNFTAVVGDWERIVDADNWCGYKIRNHDTPAQNDEMCMGHIFIPETADYTVYMIHRTNNNQGIAHFRLNDVDKGEIDTYGSGVLYNQTSSVSLGTLTKGQYAFNIKISDKNASSSDYYLYLSSVVLAKT